MRFLKLFLCVAGALFTGAFMFLHGFNAWRNGEIVVRHKGKEPFTAMAEGPFPITFATEVWGVDDYRGSTRTIGPPVQ
ncbi:MULTISPECIES: hypothetical protein [unclassified Variovorax]|uniref:hypothetical protein n=1 Tax=unclassified Variovorax TaxID=663243 RepID=UPI003F4695D4